MKMRSKRNIMEDKFVHNQFGECVMVLFFTGWLLEFPTNSWQMQGDMDPIKAQSTLSGEFIINDLRNYGRTE